MIYIRYGKVDMLALACTSMSCTLGAERIQEELRIGYPHAKFPGTDMAAGVTEVLRTLWSEKRGRSEDGNHKYSLSKMR